MKRSPAFLLALICAGCSVAEGDAGSDPVDYAAINEAAEGPGSMIEPDEIDQQTANVDNLRGPVCSFSQDGRLIFVARPDDAFFALDGEIVTLAPHPTQLELPYQISGHFDGREFSAELQADQSGGEQLISGTLVIRDAKERTVYEESGTVTCGA